MPNVEEIREYLKLKDASFDDNGLGAFRFRAAILGKPDPISGIEDPTNPIWENDDAEQS